MKLSQLLVAACLSLPVAVDSIAAAPAGPPLTPSARQHDSTPTSENLQGANTSTASCVVDVSDWPIGVLPDSASAAFGPSATTCLDVVADWPLGVLPDSPLPFVGA